MKIILTHAYFIEEDIHEKKIMKPYPPLGILYLSSFLKKNSIDVEVIDTTFLNYPHLITLLDQKKPDVLGIYCTLLTKFNVLKLIKYCLRKEIISILGGPDAATQIEEFLTFGADIIISGEGEIPLLKVMNMLKIKTKNELYTLCNVSFKDKKGRIVMNERKDSECCLDDFPFPDREAINMEKYLRVWEKYHNIRSLTLITARGCPFTCKWCSHSVFGWTHRRRSPEKVIEELKYVIARYHPNHLWYADDVFTVSIEWMRKFHRLMMAENLCLPFECLVRADCLDEERIILLKEMGCYRVWYGAESGSRRILKTMGRKITPEQITVATKLCQKYGIEAGVFVMFGYPGEELEDIYRTISFISSLQPDKYFTAVLYPLRGTLMYDEIKDDILYPTNWETHLQPALELKNRFSRKVYSLAKKKLAYEYKKRQNQRSMKQIYYSAKSLYCNFKIRQLSNKRV